MTEILAEDIEEISKEVIDIVERSSLPRDHKTLVMQIVQNMITRGLIYTVTDATIATTECIVLSHNIKRLTLQHHDSVKESK